MFKNDGLQGRMEERNGAAQASGCTMEERYSAAYAPGLELEARPGAGEAAGTDRAKQRFKTDMGKDAKRPGAAAEPGPLEILQITFRGMGNVGRYQ